MASSLEDFLSLDLDEDVIESHRVMTKGGKELEVDVKNLTLEQFKRCKKRATNSYDNPNGGMGVAQVEELSFSQELCAMGIVEPSLSNAQLRKKTKAHSNLEVVAGLFPPKSILQLGGIISQLTLADKDEKEITDGTDPQLVEEAKN